MKILIVDEIGFIRQSLTQKLARYDFATVAAESGEEALAILNTDFSVDAVLTSLFLPSMNAIDLYKAAAKIERFNDEGVIPPLHFYLMVTREHGTSSPKMKELTREALAVGFRDLLVKPIDIDLLVSKLESSSSNGPDEEFKESHIAKKQLVNEPAIDPKKITNRIDGLVVMKNSLHALKKEMCESIDILLEQVSQNSSK
ncbi:response regulator [uncultured Gimesia sp.]|uniref:response regulator n=1 Tax=uncultured Gimesia sp. TaxID=1678688 RepID=UPI0030DC8781